MKMRHPAAIKLAAYADGELRRGERRALEHHLRCCSQCQAALAELRALSARLQDFALPEGLGEELWERVERRLSERRMMRQLAPGGLWRWLAPIGLITSSTMLQAVMVVALGLWALGSVGLFDWRTLTSAWLPAGTRLPSLSLEDAVSYSLSWLVSAPLGPGFDYLVRRWGAGLSDALSWLIPTALALLAFGGLTMLYLSWLLAYFGLEARQGHRHRSQITHHA